MIIYPANPAAIAAEEIEKSKEVREEILINGIASLQWTKGVIKQAYLDDDPHLEQRMIFM